VLGTSTVGDEGAERSYIDEVIIVVKTSTIG